MNQFRPESPLREQGSGPDLNFRLLCRSVPTSATACCGQLLHCQKCLYCKVLASFSDMSISIVFVTLSNHPMRRIIRHLSKTCRTFLDLQRAFHVRSNWRFLGRACLASKTKAGSDLESGGSTWGKCVQARCLGVEADLSRWQRFQKSVASNGLQVWRIFQRQAGS